MVTQIRLFTIKTGEMDMWVHEWTTQIVPLRRKYGFRIDGAWVLPEANRFVWFLSYEGPNDWGTHDAAYYDSDDRKSIDPDPARHVEHAETWFATTVPV